MDEMKIRTPWLKNMVAKAIMKALRKAGYPIDLKIFQLDVTDSGDGDNPNMVKVRADICMDLPTSVVEKIMKE